MNIKIYAGDKAHLINSNYYGYKFSCFSCKDNNDTDTVYEILAVSLELKNPDKDLIDFQNLKDDDVKTLLDDAEKHGFISYYEMSDVDE